MVKRWLTTIRRRWQRVTGALAVLLMFFIPVTRVVLAQVYSTGSELHGENADDGTASGTGMGASGTGPTTPSNPSPKSTTGSSDSGTHTGHATVPGSTDDSSKPTAL